MEQTPLPEGEDARLAVLKREYWCFISYRHADNKVEGRKWATWLHQALETYEVPGDLVGTKNERGDVIPERIFPVFRDEEELPADAELSSPIEGALQRSRFMVVLCSPQAVHSAYVANEILRFKQLGKSNRILAAILEGEPNATDDAAKGGAAKECFPKPLRFAWDASLNQLTSQRAEPVAADFRLPDGSAGWTTVGAYRLSLNETGLSDEQASSRVADYAKQQSLMLLKIVAGVLGLPLGTLTARDKAYQLEKQRQRARTLRNWLLLVGAVGVAAIVAGLLAYVNGKEAEEQRDVAKNRQAEAEEQRTLATDRARMLSDNYLFKDGSTLLGQSATANDGLAYLARAVREHAHQTSANRLLTFMQQRPVWMLEDIGEAAAQPKSPARATVVLPQGFQGPVLAGNEEPGKADLRVKGPQGQVAVSWCEDLDAPNSSHHQGQGLHHFRVWDARGQPLTEWLFPDYEADHWVSDIKRMVFSPDGRYLAVTVGRWREAEYLLVYEIKTGKAIHEALIAAGEGANSQGVEFTEIFFTPSVEDMTASKCQFVAGTSRGEVYWMQVYVSKRAGPEAEEARAYESMKLSHRAAIRAVYVMHEGEEKLVTASEDGEVRFAVVQGEIVIPPEPHLKLNRAVTRITDGGGGTLLMESNGRQYRGTMIKPVSIGRELSAKKSTVTARIEADPKGVAIWKGNEKIYKLIFEKEVITADVQEPPLSLRVKLADGLIQTFYLSDGKAVLAAGARGHEVMLAPNDWAQKHEMLGLIEAVVPTEKEGCFIVATRDMVYQVFGRGVEEPLSKQMDERRLFHQGGVASGIDRFLLSPSGKVMLSRSKFWSPPNLMMNWITLWDCASGEPLSDRITFADEGTGSGEESELFAVSDDAATLYGSVVYRATPEMFAVLADLASHLAGLELDAKGELRRTPQSREEVGRLQKRLVEMGKR